MNHHNEALEVHRKIAHMLRSNCFIEKMMSDKKREDLFSVEESKAFLQAAQQMCHLNYQLYQLFADDDSIKGPIFQVTAKSHYLMHCAEYVHTCNPKLTWCYANEDYMGITELLHRTAPEAPLCTNVAAKLCSIGV